ncbi:MAG TPA: DUF3892 domain-containing protein [Stellaceae bacterium]|nr:DUF3892 domain-containing protein [Stellaceae bacterium]
MPAPYLISCASRTDLVNHDRRILRVGGVNPDGARWHISHDTAIAAIEAGRWSFYIEQRGRLVPVIVAVSKYGSKYLKCSRDPLQPESLLALPGCA